MRPGRHTIQYLRNVIREIAYSSPVAPYELLLDTLPEGSMLMKNYPELRCYRDVACWWKYFLNPDITVFPNYMDPKSAGNNIPQRFPRLRAQLLWQWDAQTGGYSTTVFDRRVACRPDPNMTDPITGKKVPPEALPKHRFPSTATPSFYVAPPAIKTEDDVIYRPNLPSFEDNKKQGQVLGQRDSELLISFLTVPYIRLPLVLNFFASDDRLVSNHAT